MGNAVSNATDWRFYFWNLETNCIDENIAYEGIRNAAFNLKIKPLKHSLSKIKSPHYNNILLKLGKNEMVSFNKTQLKELLNETEINILDDFIDKMLKLNIIESFGETYEFVNILYFTYFLIVSTFADDFSNLNY